MRAFLLNWVLTASLLTAAVLLLRAAFGRRISARLRYALWAAALVRLLVPGQFFTAPVEAPRVFPEIQTVQTLPGRPSLRGEAPNPAPGGEAGSPAVPAPAGGEPSSPAPARRNSIGLPALLGGAWAAGTAVMAAVFLVSNGSFARKLQRLRVPLEADCPLPVYRLAGLPSPCLFGVLRPAVYVTPQAAADPAALRHVLAHEATHYRQGDHVWSALRCAALALHWWNPLVWLAAALSRRDAELACDEGTLKVLGDGERRAYGSTLLALVTARRKPGDLLRCSTTMTGDKRSLRERVSRIARAPRRWLWAAVVSVALAALVCACSFAKTAEKHEDGPLTTEELQIFNNKVFNGDGFNMRNQLLFQAVETPEDYKHIDLFQLFYNGTGEPVDITEEERQAVAEAGYGGEDPSLDLIKCPAGEMDTVLREYLGLSLDETDQWGLDQFTYLEEYDAYYDFHGDTNYPGEVAFTSGEWKDGKVLLYYEGSGFPGLSSGNGEMNMVSPGPACVTLEPQKDGGYRFLSNWYWGWKEHPSAIPTAYPDWEPERVIPLDGLAPYEPEAVTVERHTGDVAERLYHVGFEPEDPGMAGYDVEVYRSTDGNAYAAVVVSETERDCFLTVSAEDSANWPREAIATSFQDLFGHYGVEIAYNGWLDERYYGTFTDYYTFASDGTPSLLLRAKGETVDNDLDGDGIYELTASGGSDGPQLFFQRDGRLYQADVDSLLRAAWPEAGYTDYGFWDADGRYLSMSVGVPLSGTDITVTAYRTLFFDGENLRLYKDENGYTDHIANGLEALPADVLAAARDFVQGQFDTLAAEGYGADGSGNFGSGNVVWDDWRITGLSGPYYETAGNLRVEIWNVGYETHTTTPDRVMLAGGSYVGEDGWCMIGYPGCDYLYFRLDEAGNRTFLYSTMENDCYPGSELFLSDMVRALADLGLLTPAELDGETLAKIMWPQSAYFLNNLAEQDAAEQDKVLSALGEYLASTTEGKTYYDKFCHELDGGSRAGELSEGGQAAWRTLKGVVARADRAPGEPYTLEDFEKDLAQRRKDFQEMVSAGNMTQADYDEWDQRQEEILAGLRNGTLEGSIVDGTIYFDPVASN